MFKKIIKHEYFPGIVFFGSALIIMIVAVAVLAFGQ